MNLFMVRYTFIKLGSVLIWILIPILLVACQKETRIPKDMVAAWVTENLRYQGCYVLISPEWLTIGATDATMHDYYVKQVKSSKRGQQMKVVVKALDSKQTESTFSFIYESGNGNGILYFENQPDVVWQRSPYLSPFY